MPLVLQKQIAPDISVAVWQIAETEEFFYNSLKLFSEDKLCIINVKLQNVRLQKLACRAAIAVLLGNNEIGITYSETGQPQLKEYHISFSHTKNVVAIALAKIPVGIDIEEITPRILPLYTRFMSKREVAACDTNNLQELYYYWCAKEAMYKWYVKGNLDFIEDLQVIKEEKKGIICKKHTVLLFDFWIDNQLAVVCFGEV
jgi:phosphopantetheinyl transferase